MSVRVSILGDKGRATDWWRKFREEAVNICTALEEHNCIVVPAEYSTEFDTEADLIAFIIKWS